MIAEGRAKGIEFVMPVDFVLQDGRVSETIGAGNQQFDVGPKTSELFERRSASSLPATRAAGPWRSTTACSACSRTRGSPKARSDSSRQLKRLKDAGIKVYVGGGEGGTALEKYGQPDDVTHTFTAGGTVLNALGSEPVPYLVALSMAAEKQKARHRG